MLAPTLIPTACRWPGAALTALALAAVTACSSDGTGPAPVPVAAVVITAVPTGPVLIGATIQLTATAVSATGGTIANAAFTWQTSDPLLAGVSSGGLVTVLGAGPVTITAAAGGKSGSALLDLRAGGPIRAAGGVLAVLNGAISLTFAPGTLGQSVDFLIRPAVDPALNPRLIPGAIYEVAPENLFFLSSTPLAIRYDPSRLPSGVVEAALQLYTLSAGAWTLVAGSTVDLGTRTVTGSVFRTGTYAVAGTGVDRIVMSGPALAGALYGGQTGQLVATLYDAAGNPLAGRTVVWNSSDPTRATVNGGTVTALAPGSATITAQSEGKTASTGIDILVRPTADWSQATTEWATFQGNPDHTGFVAAILDPVIFSERWVSTVAGAGTALNPVTAGPGAVFVSTASYFSNQWAMALDLGSGAPRWSKDFGGIHGVHPPAYGNGTMYVTTSGHADSYLWAFDPATGAQRFRAPYGNQWSTYYAPVVIGSRVFMAGGGVDGMYAFDANAGAELWFVSTNQYDAWTPAVRNGVVYAYTGANSPKVIAVDAVTGVVNFEIPDPRFQWDGWSMKTAPVLGAQNDLLATQAGRLVSFDLQTRTIRWEMVGGFTGAVTTSDGVLYVINGDQLEARRENDGAQLWSWSPPEGRLQKTMVVTRNLLFASTAAATYAVDLEARRQVWSYPAGGHLALTPQGVLFIARADGKLSAISVR